MMKKNIIEYNGDITRQHRNQLNKHKSGLLWFTGLPASGKSTIAHGGTRSHVLDGDNIRHGLNSNLGFHREDRKENLRRVAEVSRLFIDAGIIVLAAFISPYREDREFVKRITGGDFHEIYVKCSLEECERRDPKGQYREARSGIIKEYAGISSPYEPPDEPELIGDTEGIDVDESVEKVLALLKENKLVFSK